MANKRSLTTFFLALTAFLAVGAGGVLLVAPEDTPAQAVRSESGRGPDATVETGTPAAAAATTAANEAGTFAMVPEVLSIPRPDQPSRIVIPSIGLDARVAEVGIVVENGKPVWETAAFAVGFHRGTALPGTRGNTVMAGHISSPVSKKGDIFRRLPETRIGDRVEIYVGERRFTYEVAEVRTVAPTTVQVLNPTPDATLTLITCYPNYNYSKRLVVVGKLVEQPA